MVYKPLTDDIRLLRNWITRIGVAAGGIVGVSVRRGGAGSSVTEVRGFKRITGIRRREIV